MIKHRDLHEPGALAVERTALACPLDHLSREIDADDTISGLQERGAHQARSAAGVQDKASRRQVGFRDKPLKSNRVALHRGTLEERSLRVECAGEILVVVAHPILPVLLVFRFLHSSDRQFRAVAIGGEMAKLNTKESARPAARYRTACRAPKRPDRSTPRPLAWRGPRRSLGSRPKVFRDGGRRSDNRTSNSEASRKSPPSPGRRIRIEPVSSTPSCCRTCG